MLALVAGPRFLRGKTVSCKGDDVEVAYGHAMRGKPRSRRVVAGSKVWNVAPTPGARVGAVGACHWGKDFWHPCQVVAADAGGYRVETDQGQRREVGFESFFLVPSPASKIVDDHLALRKRERLFDAALLSAKMKAGLPLRVGDAVVAPRIGTTFVDGSVVKLTGDKVTVGWNDPVWPHRVVARTSVGRAGAKLSDLVAGQYILWRKPGAVIPWHPGKVVSVKGDVLSVLAKDGTQSEQTNVQVVAFAP